jgi:hypothetical protein
MEYNKKKYIELLKQAESLEKKGLSLYKVDRDRYLELLKYKVQFSDQKYWENRKNYFSLIHNLLNKKLTAEDFIDEFMCLWEKDRDRVDVNCEPNIESKGFARWMDKIFSRCEVFKPEAQNNEQYGEKWLKDSVNNILIQIQKEYNSL